MKNKTLLRTARLCSLGVKLRLLTGGEGGSVQPLARQKEHLLYAAVVDEIRGEETSAFASMQIQFTTKIRNHKNVSPGFIRQHLCF